MRDPFGIAIVALSVAFVGIGAFGVYAYMDQRGHTPPAAPAVVSVAPSQAPGETIIIRAPGKTDQPVKRREEVIAPVTLMSPTVTPPKPKLKPVRTVFPRIIMHPCYTRASARGCIGGRV